jgi:hypothetical protein
MWILQVFCIWLHNVLRSKTFRSLSFFDQIVQAFKSVTSVAPSMDWSDCQGDRQAHFKQMISVQKEVIGTIVINSIFQIMHVLPMAYLGILFILIY